MLILAGSLHLAAQPAAPFFDPAKTDTIALRDISGEVIRIARKSNSRARLYVFLSPECPLCRNYTRQLKELQSTFGHHIGIYGIVSGRAYTTAEVQQFVGEYSINFPVYIDPEKQLTDQLKATVTPEAVLIDASGKLIYRGAIDDWVEELGKQKITPQKMYLLDAMRSYLNNEPVMVAFSTPKGCLINEY